MMPPVPVALYKYLPPDLALKVMESLRIRFSQVSVLNDSDEFLPPRSGIAPRAEIEAQVRERFRIKRPEEYARLSRSLPPEEAEQELDKLIPGLADRVESKENLERSIREVYEKLDRNFGVLSLSETCISKLMWSFYADGGRGCLISFDSNHSWFNAKRADNDSFRHLRKVRYAEERQPTYLLSTAGDLVSKDDEVLYTKTFEWEFEKEWRIIRSFKEEAVKKGVDRYGKDILLFDIPPSCVKSIVFGHRAPKQLQKSVRTVVALRPNLSHVVFRRAVRGANAHIEIEPSGAMSE